MEKRVILVTGTPGVGKTTASKSLAVELGAMYVNLTELAESEKLAMRLDRRRGTTIVNEAKMRKRLEEIIRSSQKAVVIVDGHYAAAVAPRTLVSKVFVLRRNPVELKRLMEERGFQGRKLHENLASEILDVCLFEALEEYEEERVCELDVTGQPTEYTVKAILAVLQDREKSYVGCVDWLGMLEAQGILGEYLKT